MEQLVQSHRAAGRIAHSSHASRSGAVRTVPPRARDQTLKAVLARARRAHGATIAGWRNRCEQASLVPKVFGNGDVANIMFSHPRGKVRELDAAEVFLEADLTRPPLRFWTSCAPRTMREELAAQHAALQLATHGDVVANERAARDRRIATPRIAARAPTLTRCAHPAK